MKKFLYTFLLIFMIISLLGCTDSFSYTRKYNSYNNFAKKDKIGIIKQNILDRFGYPDDYCDLEENFHSLPYINNENSEEYKAILLNNDSHIWIYECYMFPDPANPYRLKIVFDENGKSTENIFEIVEGG